MQLFVEHLLGGSEAVLLVVMAYDHYVAVCRPLHYTDCDGLQCVLYAGGGMLDSGLSLLLWTNSSQLLVPFCSTNRIDHFICDIFPLIKRVFTDSFLLGLLVAANGGGMAIIIFLMFLISYMITLHFLMTHTFAGRKEALSTCGSHTPVVILFFGPCTLLYL